MALNQALIEAKKWQAGQPMRERSRQQENMAGLGNVAGSLLQHGLTQDSRKRQFQQQQQLAGQKNVFAQQADVRSTMKEVIKGMVGKYDFTDNQGQPVNEVGVLGYIAENNTMPPGIKAKKKQLGGQAYAFDPKTGSIAETGIPTGTEKSQFLRTTDKPVGADASTIGLPMTDAGTPQDMEISGYGYNSSLGRYMPQYKKKSTKDIRALNKSRERSAMNLDLVAGTARDLSEWLRIGYETGGAGDKYKAWMTERTAEGWFPEWTGFPEKYGRTTAVAGKRIEMIMKMFPMLTQQLEKEGSIRLVQSVLEGIGKSIPELHTPPQGARPQLESTIESMFRINRASDSIDFSGLDKKNPQGYIDRINKIANSIDLTPEEYEGLKAIKSSALKPIDEYLSGTKVGSQDQQQAPGATWTSEKENRYQELLKKQQR